MANSIDLQPRLSSGYTFQSATLPQIWRTRHRTGQDSNSDRVTPHQWTITGRSAIILRMRSVNRLHAKDPRTLNSSGLVLPKTSRMFRATLPGLIRLFHLRSNHLCRLLSLTILYPRRLLTDVLGWSSNLDNAAWIGCYRVMVLIVLYYCAETIC